MAQAAAAVKRLLPLLHAGEGFRVASENGMNEKSILKGCIRGNLCVRPLNEPSIQLLTFAKTLTADVRPAGTRRPPAVTPIGGHARGRR